MLQTVIFIGRSGCGKGTQAELFRNRIRKFEPDLPAGRQVLYVESGEHFRKFVRQNSYSSKLSRTIMEADERQPDFLACWVWSNILIDELEENMHLIIDGAPRALDEAEILTSALKFYKRENPVVIYINVSREWSEKRLLARGRADDVNLSRIDKRLNWFDRDVMPAVEYFRKNPYYRFLEINGEQTIEEVHAEIIAAHDYSPR